MDESARWKKKYWYMTHIYIVITNYTELIKGGHKCSTSLHGHNLCEILI